MVVVPVGKTKFAGTPVRVMFTAGEQSSSADATPSSSSRVAVHDGVVVVTFAGTWSVGAVVSVPLTWTVCVQLATLPLTLSVAVQLMLVVPAGYGSSVRCKPSLRTP